MWILSYWVEVARIRPLKVKWEGAEENLQAWKISKSCTDKTRVLILQVHNELACLSWSGDIKGSFATISTDHLSTYLTKKWLSDEHENQLLYLLRQQVWRKRGEDGIDVTDTYFIKKLTEIYREKDEYATRPGYAWIRKKGQDLATGVQDMLITIANVKDNHWVAVVLDFKESNIRYGDSMGGTIDGDLKVVLTWWIHHHTGEFFTTSYLPITRQQDSHSCGILAWNSLVVHLFPMENPLADVQAVADERLKAFLQISHRHNEKVSLAAFINSTLLT
jgi:Ulp1 family protease